MRHTRRAVLATAATLATTGCLGALRDPGAPPVDVEGATVAWRGTLPEPVEDIAATPDRVYVASAAPGPDDLITFDDLVPNAYAGRVDAFAPDGSRAWRTTLSTRANRVVPVPGAGVRVATGRNTMTGPREQQVRALARDGTERWTTPARDADVSVAWVVDRRTVVATTERPRRDGAGAIAVYGPDGAREWRRSVGSVLDSAPVGDTLAVVGVVREDDPGGPAADETAASTVDRVATGHGLATGAERWRRTATDLVAAGDTVYLLDTDLTAVAPATGEPRWTAPRAAERTWGDTTLAASPAVAVIGREAPAGVDGWRVDAHDPADGSRRWSATGDAGWFGTVATVADVVVVRTGGTVRGLAVTDGAERWRVDVGADYSFLLHADDRRLVVTGRADDELVSVAPRTGDVRWRATGVDGPVAAAGGRVYAGAAGGVVALDPDAG